MANRNTSAYEFAFLTSAFVIRSGVAERRANAPRRAGCCVAPSTPSTDSLQGHKDRSTAFATSTSHIINVIIITSLITCSNGVRSSANANRTKEPRDALLISLMLAPQRLATSFAVFIELKIIICMKICCLGSRIVPHTYTPARETAKRRKMRGKQPTSEWGEKMCAKKILNYLSE